MNTPEAQCEAEYRDEKEAATWFCILDKGHEGDHQDNNGDWLDPEAVKRLAEGLDKAGV